MSYTLIKNGRLQVFTPLFNSMQSLLENHSRKFLDKHAIIAVNVDRNEEYLVSYKRLLELANKTANFLFEKGVRRDNRVAFMMDNTAEIIILELACSLIGASSVPLDLRRDTLERKAFKLKDTGSKIVFVRTEGNEKDVAELKERFPSVDFIFLENARSLEKLVDGLSGNLVFPVNNLLESEYVVLYTSGTTSNPKGVPLTTMACFANAEGIIKWQQLTSSDRFNVILPLHHVNSTIFSLATLLVGGTIILNSRYSASRFWEITSRYKATVTSIVPTILHDLLARKEEYFAKVCDVSSLKRILIGSAPVLPEETLKFYETFKVDVIQGYGQTETALRVTGVPVDLEKEKYLDVVRKNSIGVELYNCNVTILNDGKEVGEYEEGEICIRGPILANGYLNDSEETSRAFSGGWFHSGDLGYYKMIDGQKYFFIKGRIKEIIIKGGINISPVAIEDVLLKNFPEIDHVCVVGYPDSRMGEDVGAVVYFRHNCSEQRKKEILNKMVEDGRLGKLEGISRYDAPQKVFEVREELPKTSTGKIKRVEVKEMMKRWVEKGVEKHYYCRLLNASEDVLNKAVEINNKRWDVKSTLSEFKERARNGYLIGVFEEEENLCGTLTALQTTGERLSKVSGWDEVTGGGSLDTHNPDGDVLLCVAISVDAKDVAKKIISKDSMVNALLNDEWERTKYKNLIVAIAESTIELYVKTNLDNVIRFHRKPKGGISGGVVTKILPNGRVDDRDALGYNILIEYPEIDEKTSIVKSGTSPSVLLIEHALALAKEKGCRKVVAFSRPWQFKFHLAKALDDSIDFEVSNHSEFLEFLEIVQEKLGDIQSVE